MVWCGGRLDRHQKPDRRQGRPGTPCPNNGTGTCGGKRAVEARGGGLSGDLKGLQELVATSLAAHRPQPVGAALLLQEGLTIEQPIVGRTPDGGTDVIAYRSAENPRAATLLKLLAQIGHTAADQAITPKSSGERSRDEGIGSLAPRAAWIAKMRASLAGEDSDDA
jgi:hypothetical protein